MPSLKNTVPRKVKIVCTLGPSSQSSEKIRELISAGMDIARLNFSHGSHAFHENLITTIRAQAESLGKTVAILQDLQGPKLRLGKVGPQGLLVKTGDRILLYPEGSSPSAPPKDGYIAPISAEIAQIIAQDTRPGFPILFDDGKISARVLETKAPEILVQIENGGLLTNNKGLNLPGTPLSIPCLMEKDLQDLAFGLRQKVDAIALSFVRSAQDIEDLRRRIHALSPEHTPLIIAKIEREEAIESMDAIIDASDGLLIARGDMAVEIGAERVPVVQKKLIRCCNELGVPIITATQMLESMIVSPTPTRAEANDVANAVFDGTDAVMLSGETASGQYPVHAVETMSRIVVEAERFHQELGTKRELFPLPGSTVESIEFSASRIADHVDAAAIVCITHSGLAARTLSKFRPARPIIAIMDQPIQVRKLVFHWGVSGVLIPHILSTDDLFKMIETTLLSSNRAKSGDTIVVTAGIPTLGRGTTNMIKVHRIGVAETRPTVD